MPEQPSFEHLERIQAVVDLVSTFRYGKTPAHDVALAMVVLEDVMFALATGLATGLSLEHIAACARGVVRKAHAEAP